MGIVLFDVSVDSGLKINDGMEHVAPEASSSDQ